MMTTLKDIHINMKNYLIAFFSIFFIMSCKSDKKEGFVKEDIDVQSTNNLISFIINDKDYDYFFESCIIEESCKFMPVEFPNFYNYAYKNLKIKDTIHFKNQIKKFEEYKLENNVSQGIKILKNIDFNDMINKAKKNKVDFFDLLSNECPNGYSLLFKPIFNEDYDLCILYISNIKSYNVSSGLIVKFEFVNNIWREKEILSTW